MNLSVIIDLAVVLVILVSAGVAFFRGFVREVLTIFGVIGGGLAALFFGGQVTPLFRGWFGVVEGEEPEKLFNLIPYNIVADVCAYASIFLAVFLILQLISHFLSASVRALGLGPVDRTLGMVFGVIRGILLLGILYLPFHLILPDDDKKDWFGQSKTFMYIEGVSQWLQSFLPANSESAAANAKEETMNSIDILREKSSSAVEDVKDKSQEKVEELKGYDDKAREKLDNLIEEKSETP